MVIDLSGWGVYARLRSLTERQLKVANSGFLVQFSKKIWHKPFVKSTFVYEFSGWDANTRLKLYYIEKREKLSVYVWTLIFKRKINKYIHINLIRFRLFMESNKWRKNLFKVEWGKWGSGESGYFFFIWKKH